jgi:hypothetical protein
MSDKILKDLFLQGEIKLSLLPEELLNDKEFIKELLAKEPYLYLILKDDFKNDIEICKIVVMHKFDLYKHFPLDIKTSKIIILLGIRSTNCSFEIFFEEGNELLLLDEDFITQCVAINGIFVQYLHEMKLLKEDLLILGIKANNLVLNLFQTEFIDDDKFLSITNYSDPEIFFKLQERIQKCIFKRYFTTNLEKDNKKRKIK